MTMRQGYVVAVHPEDHSVDLVMADDGSRLVGVQVATSNGSARSGTVDLPDVTQPGDKWDITKANGQDMKALVSFIGRNPVVTGFLYPQINQMLMKDPKARRFRHQSDVETLIDGDGNIQLTHPSGTYIRIGENPDSDYMSGKFADYSATDRNISRNVSVRVGLADNAVVLTMTPDGNVDIQLMNNMSITMGGNFTAVVAGSLSAEVTGNANVSVNGSASLRSSVSVDVDAPSISLNNGE